MSLQSYRRNVRRGVTGPNFNTCLPSSLEIVSPASELPPNVYASYHRYIGGRALRGASLDQKDQAQADILDAIFGELDGLTCQEVKFHHIDRDDYGHFRELIQAYVVEGYRLVVCAKMPRRRIYTHALGLYQQADEEAFILRSNHVPPALAGVQPLKAIHACLAYTDAPPADRPKFCNANLIAVPPISST